MPIEDTIQQRQLATVLTVCTIFLFFYWTISILFADSNDGGAAESSLTSFRVAFFADTTKYVISTIHAITIKWKDE